MIKFTEEHSIKEIAFLDTLVYKENGKLLPKVYHKKTDQKQYLHYKSSHPRNQKDAVPYGLLIRTRRICSKDKDFKEKATNIITALLKRGYPDKILLTAFNRAWSKTQEELLKSSKKIEDMRIRLITTYNQRNPPMKQLLLKFTDWLDKTKKDISRKDLQTVYKKARNLKQLLVKGKIRQNQPTLGFSTRCNKPCKTCPRMDISNTITSVDGTSYKIQGKFTCQSRYIVYVMTCSTCGKQYVGETSQTLNKRFRTHESVIRINSENNIAEHSIYQTTLPSATQ